MSDLSPTEVLYEALNHELGLVISVEHPEAFRQKLYTVMRNDPALNCFTITRSREKPMSELLIIKKGVLNDGS